MAQILKDIALSLLDIDRMPLNKRTLLLVKHLDEGGSVPPIHIQAWPGETIVGPGYDKRGRYKILDGRHRFVAFKLLGRKTIKCRLGEIDED